MLHTVIWEIGMLKSELNHEGRTRHRRSTRYSAPTWRLELHNALPCPEDTARKEMAATLRLNL